METNLSFHPEGEFIIENNGKKIIVPEKVLDDIDIFSFKDFPQAEIVCLKDKEYPVIIFPPYTFIIEERTNEKDLTIYKGQKITDIHEGKIETIPAYLVTKEDQKGYGSTLEEAMNSLNWHLTELPLPKELKDKNTTESNNETIYVTVPPTRNFMKSENDYLNDNLNVKVKHGNFDLDVYAQSIEERKKEKERKYNISMEVVTAREIHMGARYLKGINIDISTCHSFYSSELNFNRSFINIHSINSFEIQNLFIKSYMYLEIHSAYEIKLWDIDPEKEAEVSIKIHSCRDFESNFRKFPKLMKINIDSVRAKKCIIRVPAHEEVNIFGNLKGVIISKEIKVDTKAKKEIRISHGLGVIIRIEPNPRVK